MTDRYVLAIDLGTGGPKAALVGSDGSTLAWRSVPVGTTLIDGGGAEQDPNEMWDAVVGAVRAVLAAVPVAPRVAAVAVTSQYMSTIPVRADGTPTGPCILWMDSRGAANNLSLLTDESFMLFVERHGLIPLPSGVDGVGHIAVLREHHPDAWAEAAAFVEPMDYINARLTGRVCATQSSVFSLLCCDNRTWGSVEYDPLLVAAAALDPAKLPPLVPMNGFMGELTSAAAAQLGLVAGTPVAVGTIDSITSAVGSGALDPTSASVIVGTTSVLVSHIHEHRGDLSAGILAVPSPLPQRYYVMAENGVGGRALEWAQRMFGYGADVDAAVADAASIGVGAEGVQFLPWLLGSIAPQPNDDVRAAFIGLGLQHDRRHAMRAVMEGVAVNLAWLAPAVAQFLGNPIDRVRFGGGGAMSPLWAQILADALDRPVDQLVEPRATNARGAAFLAFADLGLLQVADIPSMLQIAATFEPRSSHRDVMDALLSNVVALHPALAHAALRA